MKIKVVANEEGKETVYVISGVEEFDIFTTAGLELGPIPEEEETSGFRCKEGETYHVQM